MMVGEGGRRQWKGGEGGRKQGWERRRKAKAKEWRGNGDGRRYKPSDGEGKRRNGEEGEGEGLPATVLKARMVFLSEGENECWRNCEFFD